MKPAQFLPLLLLTLGLCACMPDSDSNSAVESTNAVPVAPATDTAVAASSADARATTAIDPAVLARYHWRLESATNDQGRRLELLFANAEKPLQLDFDSSHIYVSNTCNRMGGQFTIRSDKLAVSQLTSTMMACANKSLMAMDAKVGAVLAGQLDAHLNRAQPSPQLALVTADGTTLIFNGVPTAETRDGSEGETVFLEIAATTKPCNTPRTPDGPCIEVRELHYNTDGTKAGNPGAWHVLNQPIEGYQHTSGTRNVLRVNRYSVTAPAGGAASSAYVLDLVVESEITEP